ncbi:MAG: ATP-binding cassette domain-containing protein, partial [Lachnospiraceae bacterium]|nr:ATP-binding cassette domain-containing protein [Lachnospiraceae bacterium]
EADEQIRDLLDRVDLWSVKNRKLGGFSGGMKQRALIAQALLGNPDIVILDEPTAGLDPMQRVSVRNLIKDIAADKIILVSTHVVSDIEPIAKEILVMRQGKIIADKDMEDESEDGQGIEEMYMRLFGQD